MLPPGITSDPLFAKLRAGEEIFWKAPQADASVCGPFSARDVADAEERLLRFAPLIALLFPETRAAGGLIESPLTETPALREALGVPGRLFIKRDADLPVAGSVKARGGVYEVLKHTEDLALRHGLLSGFDDDYTRLASPKARAFFAGHTVQVGSTGNLGLSIGIMSVALGYRAVVHMSADARQWKKDLLRSRGVTVTEYAGDYAAAVAAGRARSAADPDSYFVDDENSADLFLGYAVAGNRLAAQLAAQNVPVDEAHPLCVYIPCGVGGAPGGVTYGLKLQYGANVRCYFAEPTQAPCVTLGLMTGLHERISVRDAGLTGQTEADGLAVGRCSGLVCRAAGPLVSGCATVQDARLPEYQRLLWQTEGLFAEPSAVAGFRALAAADVRDPKAIHIIWTTGGSFVPEDLRREMLGLVASGQWPVASSELLRRPFAVRRSRSC